MQFSTGQRQRRCCLSTDIKFISHCWVIFEEYKPSFYRFTSALVLRMASNIVNIYITFSECTEKAPRPKFCERFNNVYKLPYGPYLKAINHLYTSCPNAAPYNNANSIFPCFLVWEESWSRLLLYLLKHQLQNWMNSHTCLSLLLKINVNKQ